MIVEEKLGSMGFVYAKWVSKKAGMPQILLWMFIASGEYTSTISRRATLFPNKSMIISNKHISLEHEIVINNAIIL